jgi:hypothetical protein
LALVLGDKAEVVSQIINSNKNSSTDDQKLLLRGAKSKLNRLQFTEKFVTPICRSLEHLSISDFETESSDFRDRNKLSSAFFLRHLPRLKILNLNCTRDIVPAIEFLYKIMCSNKKIFQVTGITGRGLRLKSTNNHLRNT